MLRPLAEIEGPRLFTAKCYPDERGFLLQSYVRSELAAQGIDANFRQAIQSQSRRGVVRGLHFQWDPPQGKLLRCVLGSLLDIGVDLRRDSPTLGDHIAVEMSGARHEVLWLPPGFAHGFMALAENTIMLYECTEEWSPRYEGGILWNDPDLGIHWPEIAPVVSQKDRVNPTFRQWLNAPRSKAL
jgi:dTDP-4-dehydrorhamnose 3,5-epimerase